MFFKSAPTQPNPWDGDPETPAKAVVLPLIELARFCEQNMSFCKANGFSTIGDNTRILAGLVQEDRAVYLAHRRLFVVRVPELHTALETMVSMPTGVDLAPLQQRL